MVQEWRMKSLNSEHSIIGRNLPGESDVVRGNTTMELINVNNNINYVFRNSNCYLSSRETEPKAIYTS